MAHPALFYTSCVMLLVHAWAVMTHGGSSHMQFIYIFGPGASIWNHGSSSPCAKYVDRLTMAGGFLTDLFWLIPAMDGGFQMQATMYLFNSIFFYVLAKYSSGFESASKDLGWGEINYYATGFHAAAHACATTCHLLVISTYNTDVSYPAVMLGLIPFLVYACPSGIKRTVWFVSNAVAWALLIGIPALACATLMPFSQRNAQRIVWVSARVYFRILLWAANVNICVQGVDSLNPAANYVFACNHTSFFDIPLLFYVLPYWTIFVCKWSVVHIPVVGWLIGLSGSIFVRRSAPEASRLAVDQGAESLLHNPRSVIIFPEGRRASYGEESVGKVHKGVIHLSKKSRLQIVPVFIKGSASVSGRGFGGKISPCPFVSVFVGKPMQDPEAEEVAAAINMLGNGPKAESTEYYPVTFEECWFFGNLGR